MKVGLSVLDRTEEPRFFRFGSLVSDIQRISRNQQPYKKEVNTVPKPVINKRPVINPLCNLNISGFFY